MGRTEKQGRSYNYLRPCFQPPVSSPEMERNYDERDPRTTQSPPRRSQDLSLAEGRPASSR